MKDFGGTAVICMILSMCHKGSIISDVICSINLSPLNMFASINVQN